MRKRTKGKKPSDINLRDFYNYYKAKHKEKPISYKEYSKIIKECNLEILDQVVNNSNEFEIPYRLGMLQIIKNEMSYNKQKKYWAVDYKRTKENGFVIYFDQKYTYQWYWNKRNAIIIGKTRYKFIPCRKAKRTIAPAINIKKVDFFKLK